MQVESYATYILREGNYASDSLPVYILIESSLNLPQPCTCVLKTDRAV